ncbi:LOW QUALITY PROTEIN: prolyl endopeptidase-like [Alosa alosa]|uniref:LOW QUALITY PROTEIN: prolyl endopeptidase-like n=1 Tax=Alosa alosa TaxID=278164 RepID=UPI0020152E32|nr:LOW QUALITY PROTEIN: prolyl endopeptidase-like [Alosa alosa]
MHSITRSLLRAFTGSACWSPVKPTTVTLAAARCYPSCHHGVQFFKCPRQEQRYRNLVQRYRRKLRGAYNKYSDIPDNTVVIGDRMCIQGRSHAYIEDGGTIYRCLHGRPGVSEPEKVLSIAWLRGGEEEEDEEEGTLQRVRLSPGEHLLAATVKTPHQEESRCIVVRLVDVTLPHQPLLILDNVFSFEWASDNTLFFSKQEGLKCQTVYRLDLTEEGVRNTLVYEEHDPEFFVEVGRSSDGQLLTLNCTSKSSSEVRILLSSAPDHAPALVQPRQPGLVYYVEHARGELYILANTGPGQEYQLLRTPPCSPSMRSWVPVFTPATGWAVRDMELLQDHCLFTLRHPSGRLHLETVSLEDPNCLLSLELPSWACAFESRRSSLAGQRSVRFLLSSPVIPPSAHAYSPSSHLLLTEHDQDLPQQDCHTTRLQAPSQDGTMVPITLLHRPPLADLRAVPMLVHVYGAYGLELNMAFSPDKRLLLERGWALAYCHVRYWTTIPRVNALTRKDWNRMLNYGDLLMFFRLKKAERPPPSLLLWSCPPIVYCTTSPSSHLGSVHMVRSIRLVNPSPKLESVNYPAFLRHFAAHFTSEYLRVPRGGRTTLRQTWLGDQLMTCCVQRLHHLCVHAGSFDHKSWSSPVGRLLNQQPQLVRAVTVQAPFLDVLGTMQDPSLPLTVEERGEWGDPLSSPQHRDNIATYCPCCNITPQRYPSMLITAYREDCRVPVSGVEKYVARLRAAVDTHSSVKPEPDTHIILDLQPGGDHFGPEDFELSLCETARQIAFLHVELGLDQTAGHEEHQG